MQWEKVLTDGLDNKNNHFICFAPVYYPLWGSRIGGGWNLYLGIGGPDDSAHNMFFRVLPGHTAETNPWPLDRVDVYPQIQNLPWALKAVYCPANSFPLSTNTAKNLEPQFIGSMTCIKHQDPPIHMLGRPPIDFPIHDDLYVCAGSPLYNSDNTYVGDATVVYKSSPQFQVSNYGISWEVEAVFSGCVTPQIQVIGFKDHVFVGLRQGNKIIRELETKQVFRIGTNASGVWRIVGEEIGTDNDLVSSFYASSDVLYAGTWTIKRTSHGAEIWKTKDGLTWEFEHQLDNPSERGITAMAEFRGALYVGTTSLSGTHLWRRDANGWTDVTPKWPPITYTVSSEGPSFGPITTSVLRSHGDTLYGGTGRPPIIFTSKDGVNWEFDTTISQADSNNYAIQDLNWFHDTIISQSGTNSIYGKEALFAGVGNQATGVQLWRASPAG